MRRTTRRHEKKFFQFSSCVMPYIPFAFHLWSLSLRPINFQHHIIYFADPVLCAIKFRYCLPRRAHIFIGIFGIVFIDEGELCVCTWKNKIDNSETLCAASGVGWKVHVMEMNYLWSTIKRITQMMNFKFNGKFKINKFVEKPLNSIF